MIIALARRMHLASHLLTIISTSRDRKVIKKYNKLLKQRLLQKVDAEKQESNQRKVV